MVDFDKTFCCVLSLNKVLQTFILPIWQDFTCQVYKISDVWHILLRLTVNTTCSTCKWNAPPEFTAHQKSMLIHVHWGQKFMNFHSNCSSFTQKLGYSSTTSSPRFSDGWHWSTCTLQDHPGFHFICWCFPYYITFKLLVGYSHSFAWNIYWDTLRFLG